MACACPGGGARGSVRGSAAAATSLDPACSGRGRPISGAVQRTGKQPATEAFAFRFSHDLVT